MGRPVVIQRDAVLDVVEQIVHSRGISSFTIGEVAKAAGISKGGVQSCFGTKDQLIYAMFERWSAEYDADIQALVGDNPSPVEEVGAHVTATEQMNSVEANRAAGMMTALLQGQKFRQPANNWYRARLDLIDPQTEEGRRLRLAFLATEGAFLLRCFGFLTLHDGEWESIFEDINALLPAKKS